MTIINQITYVTDSILQPFLSWLLSELHDQFRGKPEVNAGFQQSHHKNGHVTPGYYKQL